MEGAVLGFGVEAGAGLLGVEGVVGGDEGLGVFLLELFEEFEECRTLGVGAGVGGFAVAVEAAFVADAEGVLVVVLAVGADSGLWTALFYGAVTAHNVVVADAFPASSFVPDVDLGGGARLVGSHRAAVEDEEAYCSHLLV